jgi:hypothetical protein
MRGGCCDGDVAAAAGFGLKPSKGNMDASAKVFVRRSHQQTLRSWNGKTRPNTSESLPTEPESGTDPVKDGTSDEG